MTKISQTVTRYLVLAISGYAHAQAHLRAAPLS
jgi:hypothetical protein